MAAQFTVVIRMGRGDSLGTDHLRRTPGYFGVLYGMPTARNGPGS
jgi:hypothetical protein